MRLRGLRGRRSPPRCRHPAIARTRPASPGRLVAVLLAAGLACGCGAPGLPVQFVEGTVRLDGAAVSGAVVNFRPLDKGGLPASGSTDARGRYRLTTIRGGSRDGGALAGDYAVTISKWRNRLEDLPPEPDPSDTAARAEWDRRSRALGDLPPDYIVPKRYGDASTSGLAASVKPGRNTGPAFAFDLTSSGAPP